jgi:uncharacterized protein YktA (UPF0223 family)
MDKYKTITRYKNVLQIITCNNTSYEEFYDQNLGNESLLKQVYGSFKYVVKSTEEILDPKRSKD